MVDKIVRDSENTTGAAWLSEDAGPNRIVRWAMMLDEEDLETRGIPIKSWSPIIRAKLRERAASYDDCMAVARQLTLSVYCMRDAPEPSAYTRNYLEDSCGPVVPGTTVCLICLDPLSFTLFALAKRGKAELDMAHADPRSHSASNVGFAHHSCNVAQGNLDLDTFYGWIEGILRRAGRLRAP